MGSLVLLTWEGADDYPIAIPTIGDTESRTLEDVRLIVSALTTDARPFPNILGPDNEPVEGPLKGGILYHLSRSVTLKDDQPSLFPEPPRQRHHTD